MEQKIQTAGKTAPTKLSYAQEKELVRWLDEDKAVEEVESIKVIREILRESVRCHETFYRMNLCSCGQKLIYDIKEARSYGRCNNPYCPAYETRARAIRELTELQD